MATRVTLEKILRDRYGTLFHELRRLDYGWHSFEVVWSDDGGATSIAEEMTARNMAKRLAVNTKECVAALLREARVALRTKRNPPPHANARPIKILCTSLVPS
jgi:hypothetical protein